MGRPAMPTANPPWAKVPADLAELLRPHLQAAADEMVREIQESVPEYARPLNSRYGQRMHESITRTVRFFVDAIGRTGVSLRPVTEIYAEIGAYEARKGRGLDRLQTAIRVSGQVACRRFIRDAYRLDWSRETLDLITESLFVFLEEAARAAAEGYADALTLLATERERYRARLCALLVMDPPASREAVIEMARPAGWEAPRTIAVVALPACAPEGGLPVLPAGVLADLTGDRPYLVIPDPDGPGQDRLVAAAVRNRTAVLGPTVTLTQGAVSLRWARHALALVESGVIVPDSGSAERDLEDGPRDPVEDKAGVVRCVDHVTTLVTWMSRDLVAAAASTRLARLMDIPPHRRAPLVRTLLTYMASGDNAVVTARRLHIHQQTVRYRVRRLEEMCGTEIFDPRHRLEVMLALHAWSSFDDRTPPT